MTTPNSSPGATLDQYQEVLGRCKALFLAKLGDYGASWRILRPISVTDQLFIKGRRIRSIQESGIQKIEDTIESEFIALVNYALIGCIQLEKNSESVLSTVEAQTLYEAEALKAQNLMLAKNHDYGEAWREMRLESLVDLILVKLFRIKQIEDNHGLTTVSEGIEANYLDIANYALFALIKISEANRAHSV